MTQTGFPQKGPHPFWANTLEQLGLVWVSLGPKSLRGSAHPLPGLRRQERWAWSTPPGASGTTGPEANGWMVHGSSCSEKAVFGEKAVFSHVFFWVFAFFFFGGGGFPWVMNMEGAPIPVPLIFRAWSMARLCVVFAWVINTEGVPNHLSVRGIPICCGSEHARWVFPCDGVQGNCWALGGSLQMKHQPTPDRLRLLHLFPVCKISLVLSKKQVLLSC